MKKLLLVSLIMTITCVSAWAGVTVSNSTDGGLNGSYSSFSAAITAIGNNKTAGHVITLNSNESTTGVTNTNSQYISEINLANKTLTATGTIVIQQNCTLYVHDGTIMYNGATTTNSKLAFSPQAKTACLRLEKISQDPTSAGMILYNLPNSQKQNVPALVCINPAGTVTIDAESDVNVYCSATYANLSSSSISITNSGSGTTYFYNQTANNGNFASFVSSSVTGNVVFAPSAVYVSAYDAVATYIPDALKDKKYPSLSGTTTLTPVYKFNTAEAAYVSAITLDDIDYKFTNIPNSGSQEHPVKLIEDYTCNTYAGYGYIDLNGHTWTFTANGTTPAINPGTMKKELKIVNTKSTGGILINGTYSSGQYAMQLKTASSSTANYYVLTIGEGVIIDMPKVTGYALAVMENNNGEKGYGAVFNLQGTINVQNGAGLSINGSLKNNANKENSPIFNIAGTINAKDAAIYAAGYGEWNINDGANLSGKSGIQIKSGKLNINDGAIVHATGEGSRVPAYNNGMIESGAALQIESNSAYAGAMEIAIANDATLKADAWYAIHEYVAEANDPTAVKSIAVTGGHFQGGILISQDLATKGGFVSGGKWSKDVTANVVKGKVANPISEDPYFFEVGDPTSATAEIVNDPSKNAVLTNEDGETYAGSYSSESVGDDAEVKTSTATNQAVITKNTDVVVDDTNEGNSTIVEVKKVTVEGDAELNVKEGATLMVGSGSVLLNEETTTGGLTVEAGAALVVEGLVYGSTAENFVIEGEEDKSGIVLFSPETEFIREDHPKATYRFTSKSFRDGSKWVYQRFGMPSVDGNVTVKSGNMSINSYICTWDYEADDWGTWRKIESADGLAYTDAVPFQCYELGSTNAKNAPVTYDFIVDLMGNANAPLNFKTGWNPYANSYTAPIDIKTFLNDVIEANGGNILATIYLYKDLGDDTYTWQGINLSNVGTTYRVRENGTMVKKFYESSIKPMQAFIMKLSNGEEATQDIDYLNNVYNPAMGIEPAPAPARNNAAMSRVQIGLYNDMYWDNISLTEGEQFSAAEDNGYDAPKYNSTGLILYAINGSERMERVATDNLDGWFLGLQAPAAGTYTIDFSGVENFDYALIDRANNTIINIMEDGEYTFNAAQGENNYRFQIVAANKVPTAIENMTADKQMTGVYSITGQYLGEDVNALPKGVYIINGTKVVK